MPCLVDSLGSLPFSEGKGDGKVGGTKREEGRGTMIYYIYYIIIIHYIYGEEYIF